MLSTMIAAALAVAAPAPTDSVAPAPASVVEDGTSIDTLVKKLYAVISGPAGTRDWDRFRRMFVKEGRLVPTGANGPRVLTVEEFIARAGANVAKEGFYESEVARRTEQYGNIAHLFSTYESRHAPGEAPFARGINSFQLVRVDGKWRVLSIFWQQENKDFPVPAAYLTAPAGAAK